MPLTSLQVARPSAPPKGKVVMVARSAHREQAGRILRVSARDEDTGETLARFKTLAGDMLTISGSFVEADIIARHLTIWGRFAPGRRGRVFRVQASWRGPVADDSMPPVTGVAMLASELLRKVGPTLAGRLAEKMGPGLWDALVRDPMALVPYVGADRAVEYHRTIVNLGVDRATALAQLMGTGLSYAYAIRVLASLGSRAWRSLAEDPYRIIGIPGIRFATADKIARRRFHVAPDDPRRLGALAIAVLEDAADDGDTSIAYEEAIERLRHVGSVDDFVPDAVAILNRSVETGRLAIDMGDVYLKRMIDAERRGATGLARLITREHRSLPIDVLQDPALAAYDPEQRRAIDLGLRCGVVLINGRPGTGKTTVAREIVRYARDWGIPVTLAATTGNAAEQLAYAIAYKVGPGQTLDDPESIVAHTIQSLAGNENPGRTLPRGIVIVDEASMLDLPLLARIVDNTGDETTLVFLGDPNQLPPVMAGNSSRDLEASGAVPIVELTTVHRLDRASLVGINAERILNGKMPIFGNSPVYKATLKDAGVSHVEPASVQRNAFFRSTKTTLDGAACIVETVQRLRDAKGYVPATDIQVYLPTKPGIMGVSNLNRLLQAALNPDGEVVRSLGTVRFRVDPPPRLPSCSRPIVNAVQGHESGSRNVLARTRRYTPVAGDVVEFRRADRAHCIPIGTRASVLGQTDAGGLRICVAPGTLDARDVVLESEDMQRLVLVYDMVLRVGDPVLQTRNVKERGLVNGKRGVVVEATGDHGAVVDFRGRLVTYTRRQASELALAYASTVHKGQGQESKATVLGIHHAEHRVLLDKSLLYVGSTRAMEMNVIVGTTAGIRICLKESHGPARHTRLAERTARIVGGEPSLGVVSEIKTFGPPKDSDGPQIPVMRDIASVFGKAGGVAQLP